MLKEALERLHSLSVAATGVDIIDLARAGEQPGTYATYVRATGAFERRVAEPRNRAHKVYSLAQLSDAVRLCRTDATPARVWVGKSSVQAVLDDAGRRINTVTFALTESMQFKTLAEFGQPQGQSAFLRTLRVNLAGCCLNGNFESLVSKIRISTAADGERAIKTGMESVSKSVKSEMFSGGEELPTYVEFQVPVYDELAQYTETIRCLFDVDIAEGKFALVPLAGQVHEARRATADKSAADLRKQLVGQDGVEVLIGEP